MADLRSLLAVPALYSLYQNLVRGGRFYSSFAREYIRAAPGQRVLDIGCGPADILRYLPAVDYVGVDSSKEYLAAARRRFGAQGTFLRMRVDDTNVGQLAGFDIVLAQGLLHHLDDSEAVHLFRVARAALKPDGRLVTLDGVYVPGQPRVARFLIARDRGRHVRSEQGYRALAAAVFPDVESSVRHDLFRVPYSLIIQVCRKPVSG